MPYVAPGVYSTFVNTAGSPGNPGASRLLALIGTGVQTYTVYNEPVLRNPNATTDMLSNEDVYQVLAVTSKPYYPKTNIGNNITFASSPTTATNNVAEYSLQQGAYVSWTVVSGTLATPALTAGPTSGAASWLNAQSTVSVGGTPQQLTDVVATLDTANPNVVLGGTVNDSFLAQNGQFMVEITYVSSTQGTYRVVNMANNETLGQYVAGNVPNYEAIPGVVLTVQTTFVPNPADTTGQTSLTNVGDYLIVTTTAGQTYGLPSGSYTVNANNSLLLANGTTYSQPKSPTNNSVYYVSYKYRKQPSAYLPSLYFSSNDVIQAYGPYNVTTGGTVINSLSLGTQLAMLNGAVSIVCVQSVSQNDGDLNNAINLLKQAYPGIETVNAIVPLTDFTNTYAVASFLSGHVSEMSTSEYNKERMGYVADINPADTAAVIAQNAAAFENDRLVFVAPASVQFSAQDPNTGVFSNVLLPGSYLAAAVAGLAMGQDPAEPLTNKVISGFNNLGALYYESDMNLMASNGVCVLKQNGSVIRVRHGITTSTAGVNASEITLTQIRDYTIQSVRQALGAFVGTKLLVTAVSDVKSTLQGILSTLQAQNIILGYNITSVQRDPSIPDQINVSFQIQAVYPLNFIDISFGFSQSTGVAA